MLASTRWLMPPLPGLTLNSTPPSPLSASQTSTSSKSHLASPPDIPDTCDWQVAQPRCWRLKESMLRTGGHAVHSGASDV